MGAYQLKITIKGSKPPIWRRILVPKRTTFKELHQMIHTAFCWSGDRPYQFELRSEGVRVEPEVGEASDKFKCVSSREAIDSLLAGARKFTYTYSGDICQEAEIQVEEPDYDYQETFAKVIKFKDVPSEEQEAFDVDAVNERLKRSGVHLIDLYESYDKNTILEIARRHSMNGCSRCKKEELMNRTAGCILDKEEMRSYFLCASDSEIALFEQVQAGKSRLSPVQARKLDYLAAGGYVVPGTEGESVCLTAEETAEAYRSIDTPDFRVERTALNKIGDYFRAANALYGITPPSVILEIFHKYEERKLTLEELLHACDVYKSWRPLVEYTDGCFVDAALSTDKRFKDVCLRQKKVPYYIPTRREVRTLAEDGSVLRTESLDRLGTFFTEQVTVSGEMLPALLFRLQTELRLGGGEKAVRAILEDQNIVFQTNEQSDTFAALLKDVWNHTRLVINRGHMPYEMVMRGLEDLSVQRKNIQKIYPNNPCPCGSGKKYKKCCGK